MQNKPPQQLLLTTGKPYPLGASLTDDGVNFAVFSEHATHMELCLYDADSGLEQQRLPMHGPTHGVFHACLLQALPGLIYAYRAYGASCAEQGQRFHPEIALLDPYAKGIVKLGDERRAVVMPADEALQTQRPHHLDSQVVLYEVHVKGFSQTAATLPTELRGRYEGLAHATSIAHLKSLGVTTLCLLPVQHHLDEGMLTNKGLVNYWGYNTLGFFCADPIFAADPCDPIKIKAEFQRMVQALHAKGIEVVLDVVYNHTPEGNEQGPALSFRGLDNESWYWLDPHQPSSYQNHTGCGNSLRIAHPRVTQFVLDSLRYWVEVMGVDGFRFDLATVLGRTRQGFDAQAAFFTALLQDPVLAKARLIAEPWDIGADGYQLGHFPGRFMEWNDKFRDTMRHYWLHRAVNRGEFVRRFMASSDVFYPRKRNPTASINYIAVHDGYTLRDMVSYQGKHNWANGEDNRDGRDNEPANNFGVEGETADAQILLQRQHASRALMATLLLAQGTPMLCAGDEIGKTQQGNNNAYCQDNATSWLNWAQVDEGMMALVQRTLQLRKTHALLRPDTWLHQGNTKAASISWLKPDGHALSDDDWHATHEHAIACALSAQHQPSLYIAFNPHLQSQSFQLPAGNYQCLMDSSSDNSGQHEQLGVSAMSFDLHALSVAVFMSI